MNETESTVPEVQLPDTPPEEPAAPAAGEPAALEPSETPSPSLPQAEPDVANDPTPAAERESADAPAPDQPQTAERSAAADPPAPDDELADLREEVNRLREQLRRTEAESLRVSAECEEFRSLYPDVPLSSLPDSVWEDVRRGVPVSAAFALAERRRYRTSQLAEEANRENRKRSSGSLEQDASGYLSPDEVRAMSPEEVRRNYHRIMLSMQKWQGGRG